MSSAAALVLTLTLAAEPAPGLALQRLLAGLEPPSPPVEECERPEKDESFCGFVNGACIYCPSGKPHFCPSKETCFSSAPAAKSACGWTFILCQTPR
jgi:hypothetical protein